MTALRGRDDRGRPRARGTSPSTRSRCRSPAASRSTRPAGSPTLDERLAARGLRAHASPTTRCGCCARRASRRAHEPRARARDGRAGAGSRRRAPPSPPASASSPSCAGCSTGPDPLRGARPDGRARGDRRGVCPSSTALRGVDPEPEPPPRRPRPHAGRARATCSRSSPTCPRFAGDARRARSTELLAEPLADELTRGGGASLRGAAPRHRQARHAGASAAATSPSSATTRSGPS